VCCDQLHYHTHMQAKDKSMRRQLVRVVLSLSIRVDCLLSMSLDAILFQAYSNKCTALPSIEFVTTAYELYSGLKQDLIQKNQLMCGRKMTR
jgi:hypothetical protein